jgi:hypothetical protein
MPASEVMEKREWDKHQASGTLSKVSLPSYHYVMFRTKKTTTWHIRLVT